MRHYETNSREAVSRLIALALLADGGLDRTELDVLRFNPIIEQLDIPERILHRVTQELCDDMTQCVSGQGLAAIPVPVELIDSILMDLTEPGLCGLVFQLMNEIVNADGYISEGESRLLRRASEIWQQDALDCVQA